MKLAGEMKMTFRHAFTLIELLVVMAIIGILAALLFPVVIAAENNAQRTVCLNNTRQINLAIQTYCDDFNGEPPRGPGGPVPCQRHW